MRGRAIPYSAAEMAWLKANHRMVMGDYHRTFVTRFGRADVSPANLHSLRKRMGWTTGRSGHFPKGHTPANKGQKGYVAPGCERTWFRKGSLNGVAAARYKPVGTERLCKDGYRERKVREDGPSQSRWRYVHLIEWEAVNGPVPDGYALKCLDGDRRNTDPSNWTAVPRALLPRLNGGRHKRRVAYDDAPAELKPAILTVAKLEQRIREARRGRTA